MHPLLMPSLLFALLFYYAPVIAQPINPKAANYLLLAIFITTFVLPMISITALRFSDIISHNKFNAYSLLRRQDRILPFFFTGIFYLITTYMFFSKFRVNQVLIVILAAITVIIFLVSLISLFIKVSAHAASAGALIGFLISLGYKYPDTKMIWPLVAGLLLAGAVMSARLYLNTHKPTDILVGCLLGLLISGGAVFWFG
jgi:hypothetical protein